MQRPTESHRPCATIPRRPASGFVLRRRISLAGSLETASLRRRIHLAAALAGLLLTAPRADAAVLVPGGFVDDTLLSGLDEPTSMAFLPDGRMLVTEQRTGRVRLVVNGHIAATDPVLLIPELTFADYERGLQSVAVDPGWPDRPYAYFYYTRIGGF